MKPFWHVVTLVALLWGVALAQDAPKKVTKSEAMNAVASKVSPDYPIMAKQLRIQGTVELEAVVAESGEVAKVEIVSGNPILTAASVQAVKRWKFKPFLDDGRAVRVLAPISLDFKL
jgi:periplasmic protein TonB